MREEGRRRIGSQLCYTGCLLTQTFLLMNVFVWIMCVLQESSTREKRKSYFRGALVC
jgi:hypothetical protein